ncbi:NAD(P)H-binding protein [Streptomyces sp. N2-109]|uniref:NAD(P)H-binding protein n=1 Tax=Streptomyces gossypii TaxID=2883101 RepID=A0ABT2K591_9ACTN|nr:NAD(P)H-binding protein [Streptomyces gossypii]MCT2594669.1 NAD(P)H-binding protein [Streptomyces gossypii]
MTETPRATGAPRTPSTLVTGAAGNLGREIVDALHARGVRVRCLDRNPAGARPGVESVVGDLTDPGVLRSALAGIDAVLLMWPMLTAAPAHAMLAQLSAESPTGSEAPRVVYLSSSAVDDGRDRQTDPIVQVHADMEALLSDAGLRPVVLRSETLASNVRGWAEQLRAGDVVAGPDIARTAVVDERDVADAAVTALLSDGAQVGRGPHVLTGPEVLGRADQVAQLGTALGRRLRFEAVPAERARARMLADGRPEALVAALIAASLHRPESGRVTDCVERLVGRAARTFAQWAADHAAEFD